MNCRHHNAFSQLLCTFRHLFLSSANDENYVLWKPAFSLTLEPAAQFRATGVPPSRRAFPSCHRLLRKFKWAKIWGILSDIGLRLIRQYTPYSVSFISSLRLIRLCYTTASKFLSSVQSGGLFSATLSAGLLSFQSVETIFLWSTRLLSLFSF